MKELTIKEEKKYYGGGGITSAFINAVSKGVNTIVDIGRYFGSAIRRIFNNNLCDF